MKDAIRSVRKAAICDHEKIVGYFLNADPEFLTSMDVDLSKLPNKKKGLDLLGADWYDGAATGRSGLCRYLPQQRDQCGKPCTG